MVTRCRKWSAHICWRPSLVLAGPLISAENLPWKVVSTDTRVLTESTEGSVLLLAQGVDQHVVMEIIGHSQISMTSRYAHVVPQLMTDAAERIGRALWGDA